MIWPDILKLLLITVAPVLFIYSLVALVNERKGREHYVVIIAASLLAIASLSHGLNALDSNQAYGQLHDLTELAVMILFFFVLREHIHEHLHAGKKKKSA
ncbi:MAG: hypothetical protein V1811_00835 [Candidatus Micrarchaeota archaeon]